MSKLQPLYFNGNQTKLICFHPNENYFNQNKCSSTKQNISSTTKNVSSTKQNVSSTKNYFYQPNLYGINQWLKLVQPMYFNGNQSYPTKPFQPNPFNYAHAWATLRLVWLLPIEGVIASPYTIALYFLSELVNFSQSSLFLIFWRFEIEAQGC